jgi:hypothetical protein
MAVYSEKNDDAKKEQAINASTARAQEAARAKIAKQTKDEFEARQKGLGYQQAQSAAATYPIATLNVGLNTGGAQSKLDTSILNTDTKRKGSRISSYAALRKIAREGTGSTQQLGNVMAETGNKRGEAFQGGFQDINQNTSSMIAQNKFDKAAQESQYVEADRIAKQDFEQGIIDAYYARAASMNAQVRQSLADGILKTYGIDVNKSTTGIIGETK